jgi:DedD protein
MATDDSDITIGPGKLLGLFFMLVVICGVFFAIGYSLGKTTAHEQAINDKAPLSASLSAPVVGDSSAAKPSAAVVAKSDPEASSEEQTPSKQEPDLTFFNAVKQSDRSKQTATIDAAPTASPKATPDKAAEQRASMVAAPVETRSPVPAVEANVAPRATPKTEEKPTVSSAAGGAFVVQIAAVTREEDAAALAGALRKKNYSVFVVNNPAVHDKFYHVQIGPFATLQDADAMKSKLTGEGYNPIVKRS